MAKKVKTPKGQYNWSVNNSPYANSAHWLGADSFNREKGAEIDIVQLAAYNRAIANFVRISSGRTDIPVRYSASKNSYTDGKSVTISSKVNESKFDCTVGLALHEGSHIAMTDFKEVFKLLDPLGYKISTLSDWLRINRPDINVDTFSISKTIKDLINVLEDRRIDQYVCHTAPGYQGYYKALYQEFFESKEITKALVEDRKCSGSLEDYMFQIINFINPAVKLDCMPGLRNIWNLMDIPNVSRLKSTMEVAEVCIEVWKELMLNITSNNSQDEESNDSESNDEESDDSESNDSDSNDSESNDEESDDNGEDVEVNTKGSSQKKGNSSNTNELSAREQAALDKAIAQQENFLAGKITKSTLKSVIAAQVNAALEANMTYVEVGSNTVRGFGKTKCVVVNGLTESLISSGVIRDHCNTYAFESYKKHKSHMGDDAKSKLVEEAIMLGTQLGKRLKTRDEERSIKTSRLDSGRIDRRLINELGFNNTKVFSQVLHNTVKPALVHISVDASGSMSGSRWRSAIKTAIAIAKAGTMVSSLDVIISIRGTYASSNASSTIRPMMWTIYDSRKDSFTKFKELVKFINPAGSTPEGLCYQAVLSSIIKDANGKDAFLINICDGEPGFTMYDPVAKRHIEYGGEFAIEHTRTQVNKMRQAGIKVLSFFAHADGYVNDRSIERHKAMYGKDAVDVDTSSLSVLSKTINSLFERV